MLRLYRFILSWRHRACTSEIRTPFNRIYISVSYIIESMASNPLFGYKDGASFTSTPTASANGIVKLVPISNTFQELLNAAALCSRGSELMTT